MPARSTWLWLVEAALEEDLGPGDATSLAVLPEGLAGSARVEARSPVVLAGLGVARQVFERTGSDFEARADDGDRVDASTVLATVRGEALAILSGERTALNFLQRLSGVATLTHEYCEAVRGTRAEIIDTRKTTPGWRQLEKYAVRCGGGGNHRMGLFDGILIKDNHIAAVGGVSDAVKLARSRGARGLKIRVEVESIDAAREAIDAGADALLVDNQTPATIAEIVALAAGRLRVEASGGVTLETVAEIARTGVDEISVGALTHSAPAADIALEWNPISST
ncbi:MAG: carboxylating nicotinate-nucleotide diphosphorylase [Myxococcota bacterium]